MLVLRVLSTVINSVKMSNGFYRVNLSRHLPVLPRRNEPDLEDVTEDVRRELQFLLVDSADEVLTATRSPVKQTELILVG